MLDSDTKSRIDSARNMLVGKVPNPQAQVEQITIALIYKFMDDMDASAEELGGKRKFFTKDFAKYGWAKLMSPGIGGHDLINLYGEGISTMPTNPGIPLLFRDIFKNAYLPYRDPETLKSFLKIINEFSYDHSERLGDAFEYLLSVLGSQGDAGQFRTPRHIIDFIVEILAPKKGEVVLDPACGTAGFLISAYKYILRTNTNTKGQSKLTPDERGGMAKNFKGYDISPDMVRLSLVNLYLHGFTDPHIHEYDTLTSEERWNEYADVILANPPFMSPSGGIKPHKRFTIQAKRSEVLFVDYMAEHLTPKGRAGIIVPEGIIFQSQTAYKELRKMLVGNSLVAVISLPAGCFNPYSGVKTSILILDKSLAKKSDSVAFFKVENDGFGLGAQRRVIEKNDLTQVKTELDAYLDALRKELPTNDLKPRLGLIVHKERIGANGDFNLSGERYRESSEGKQKFPQVDLGSLCKPEYGFTASAEDKGDARFVRITDIAPNGRIRKDESKYVKLTRESNQFLLKKGDLLVARTGATFGKTMLFDENYPAIFASYLIRLRFPEESLIPEFYWAFAQSDKYWEQARSLMTGGGQPQFNGNALTQIKIPLPPLEVQREIVAEIEGYQKVIDGARAVLENYRPNILINPDWPMVRLGDVSEIQRGKFSYRPRNEPRFYGGKYPFIQTGDIVRANGGKITYSQTLNQDGLEVSKLFSPPLVVITIAANIGDTAVLDFPSCFPDSVVGLIPKAGIDVRFLELTMRTKKQYLNDIAPQAAQKNINIEILKTVEIPMPPFETQQAIVAEIEAEEVLVNANRDLMSLFEKKIEATLARVWGEETSEENLNGGIHRAGRNAQIQSARVY